MLLLLVSSAPLCQDFVPFQSLYFQFSIDQYGFLKHEFLNVKCDDGCLYQLPSRPAIFHCLAPDSEGAFAGTFIFLLLASILRCLLALKTTHEHRWLDQARKRRYVLVANKGTEASKIEGDPNAKNGCLITAQGVEENVKAVDTNGKEFLPFRLSVDVPRAAVVTIITGVAYLL
jgi:hypothetical protein